MRLALTAHDLIQCTNLTQPYEAEDGRGLNLLQAEGNDEVQRNSNLKWQDDEFSNLEQENVDGLIRFSILSVEYEDECAGFVLYTLNDIWRYS
ncbi:hypothetical protein EMCRGX_G003855 [Ephydatia muelleri]